MTSAWKLLYIWKSRGVGRTADVATDSDCRSGLRRPHQHRRGHSGERLHLATAQSGQLLHARSNLCGRNSVAEHESHRLDSRNTNNLECDSRNSVGLIPRVRQIRSNQLPDAVIQARERLDERLRGVTLQRTRDSTMLNNDPNNSEFVNTGVETSSDWLNCNEQKKQYVVDWEVLCTIHLEIFRSFKGTGSNETLPECCICLESFCEGDSLILLRCEHRFHIKCLEPWIRTCNDCPYCRTNITC